MMEEFEELVAPVVGYIRNMWGPYTVVFVDEEGYRVMTVDYGNPNMSQQEYIRSLNSEEGLVEFMRETEAINKERLAESRDEPKLITKFYEPEFTTKLHGPEFITKFKEALDGLEKY